MKINVEDYLTIDQVAEAIGGNKRSAYRALNRAAEAGEDVIEVIFGKRLVRRSNIEVVKRFYFPYYSDAHQAMVKVWGAKGGKQKKINSQKASRS